MEIQGKLKINPNTHTHTHTHKIKGGGIKNDEVKRQKRN